MFTALLHDPQISGALAKLAAAGLALTLNAVAIMAGRLLKDKLNASTSDWKQKVAYRLVCYAEKRFIDNAERRQYVAAQLAALLKIDPTEAEHLLEEALTRLEIEQGAAADAALPIGKV